MPVDGSLNWVTFLNYIYGSIHVSSHETGGGL
jgi:hypothetical protein